MSGRGGGRRSNESMAPTQQATPSPSSPVSRISSELEHGLTLQTQQPTVARASQPKPEMKTTAVQQQKLAASSKAVKLPVGTGFSDQDLHHYDISINLEVISRRHTAVMRELLDKHGNTEFDAYDGRKGFYTAGALPFTSKDDCLGSSMTQQPPRGSHDARSTLSPLAPVSRLSSELEHGLNLQTQQPTVARDSHPKPEMKTTAVQQQKLAASSKALKPPVGTGCMIRANHLLVELSDRDLHHYDRPGHVGTGHGSHDSHSTLSLSGLVSQLSSELEHGLTLQTQQPTVARASQPKPEMKTMAVQQQKLAASSKAVKLPVGTGFSDQDLHHYDRPGHIGTGRGSHDSHSTLSLSGLVSQLSSELEHGITLQTQKPTVARASQPKPEMKTMAVQQQKLAASSKAVKLPVGTGFSDQDLHHYDRPGHVGTGRGSHDSRSTLSLSGLVSQLSSELEHGLTLQTQLPTVACASQPKPEMKTMAVQQQKLAASSKAVKLPVGTGFSDQDLHHYDISITPEVISRRHKVVMAEILDKHGKTKFDGCKAACDGRKRFYTAGALPFTSMDFPGSTIKQELPMDLAVQILCRLPVKSVLRFRCLSKELCSVIDGPTFIKCHQICSTNSNKSLVVSGISGISSVDFDSIDTMAVHLPLPSESWFFRTSIVGSCDGLLALYNSKLGIALLNIATRKHLILPQFWSDFDSFSKFYDGFGYDSASDAYKLVRIVNLSESLTEVTVYNLRENTWRKIDVDFPYFLEISHGVGTFVGGALNWIVGGVDSDCEYDNFILSFDIQKDTFSLVPKPHITDRRYDICIGDLGGSLYLSCNKEYDHAFDIWVMNEYGVEKSWGKLFSFSFERPLDTLAVSPMTRALAYTKRGDKVLLYRDDRSVFWYDLGEKRLERVGFKGWPSYISKVIVYEGSLVSPFYIDS